MKVAIPSLKPVLDSCETPEEGESHTHPL